VNFVAQYREKNAKEKRHYLFDLLDNDNNPPSPSSIANIGSRHRSRRPPPRPR
jgi:hypothetical protein